MRGRDMRLWSAKNKIAATMATSERFFVVGNEPQPAVEALIVVGVARNGFRAIPRARRPRVRSRSCAHEMRDLKEALAEQVLENRLFKKSMIGDGGDGE